MKGRFSLGCTVYRTTSCTACKQHCLLYSRFTACCRQIRLLRSSWGQKSTKRFAVYDFSTCRNVIQQIRSSDRCYSKSVWWKLKLTSWTALEWQLSVGGIVVDRVICGVTPWSVNSSMDSVAALAMIFRQRTWLMPQPERAVLVENELNPLRSIISACF